MQDPMKALRDNIALAFAARKKPKPVFTHPNCVTDTKEIFGVLEPYEREYLFDYLARTYCVFCGHEEKDCNC